METTKYFSELIKPTWAPPASIFGIVWPILYILIAISFGKVFILLFQKQISFWVALPFILNLIFNLSFTYFQFGLKNNYLAALDILLVLITLIWAMLAISFTTPKLLSAGGPNIMWVALINIPYLLWVSFATVLQLTITYLNR